MDEFIVDYIRNKYELLVQSDWRHRPDIAVYCLTTFSRLNPAWYGNKEYVFTIMMYREQVTVFNGHQLGSVDFELIPTHQLAFPAPLGHPNFFELLDKGVRAKRADAFGIWASYQQWKNGRPLNKDGTPIGLNNRYE